MFSSEVSPGFNRLPGHLCLTNGIVRRAQSRRLRFEHFFSMTSTSECKRACGCLELNRDLRSGTPRPPSPSPTVGFEPPRCNKVHVTLLLPPPPPLLHPSCCVPSRAKLVSVWSGESILTYIPEPGLTHVKKKKKTVTHSESWKPAHVRRCAESQLSVSLVQETTAVGGGGGSLEEEGE